jgi:hypothetical protein
LRFGNGGKFLVPGFIAWGDPRRAPLGGDQRPMVR